MPKIDPITGCQVMTLGEFWNAEAEREGKGREGWELADDMYADMERERLREEQAYRDDHERTLKELCDAVRDLRECDEDFAEYPYPDRIVEVLEVTVTDSFRESGVQLKARAMRGEVEDVIELTAFHSSGSFYEPPDGEINVWWHGLEKPEV